MFRGFADFRRHTKHIKNIKIHSSTYLITDEAILSKYPEKKLEEVAVPDF
jgi:hypothetical protein